MLEAVDLCKSFDGKLVIDHLSMHLQTGHHYCLMGASGCGKTTLLNLLMGLIKPDSGKIHTHGARMSAVFQEDRLLEQMTAHDNVALVSTAPDDEIHALLQKLGIDEESLPQQPVSTYSGGMKRRVALCRALLADFDVLFLDEPYKGLDDETRTRVMELVSHYTQDKTVLLVTHDREEADGYEALNVF